MSNDEKYILTLTREQALTVSKACEFYARVMMGQFGEIAFETMLQSIKQDDFCTRREMMEDLLFQARKFAFPDLMSRGHSYGIGHSKPADRAWNAYQAIRYAVAWHEHPEGGITVDFRKPYPAGGEAVPDCKVDADPIRHARWEEHDGKTWCSHCGKSNKAYKPPFCPHCGTKMDGGAVADE